MKNNYLNLYNNFIKLTTNKSLYKGISTQQDVFSDRLTLFLLHFAFFLKEFKNPENQKLLQEIYDFNFRQLELNIREIGYGDQTVNKKMKDYINNFHAIISNIHFWEDLNIEEKKKKISPFLTNFENITYLVDYFEKFNGLIEKNSYF